MAERIMRREYLTGIGSATTVALAGCTGGDDGGGSDDGGGTDGDDGTDGGGQTTSAGDEEIEIRYSSWLPEGHINSRATTEFFVPRIEELTGGQVQFDVHFGHSLGDPTEHTRLIRDQTAHGGIIAPTYETGAVPLSTVADLPGMFRSALVGSKAFHELAVGTLSEIELEPLGIKPFQGYTLTPYNLFMRDQKVDELSDFPGLQIRSSGGHLSRTLNALGASPVEVPGAEMYEAINRGTVDGTVLPVGSVPAWDLGELLGYASTNMPLGNFGGLHALNLDIWESFPENVKDAFRQAGRETAVHNGELQDEEAEKAYTTLEDRGVELYEASESNWSEISDELDTVVEDWAADLPDKPVEDLVSEFENLIEEARNNS